MIGEQEERDKEDMRVHQGKLITLFCIKDLNLENIYFLEERHQNIVKKMIIMVPKNERDS